jgi:hypothetical protein
MIRLALIMIRRETEKPCDQSIERIKAIIKALEAAEYDEAQLAAPSRDYVDPDKPF